MTRHPAASGAFLLVLLATTVFVTASAPQLSLEWHHDPEGAGGYALGPGVTLAEPFTIEARFRVLSERDDPVIWLAGWADQRGAKPDALALVWRRTAAGWFPVWKLQLVSRLGILPQSMVDGVDQGAHVIDLADAAPKRGEAYRAVLSFDPAQDVLSVLLEEVESGAVLYVAYVPVGRYRGTLYPGAGWEFAGGRAQASGAASSAPSPSSASTPSADPAPVEFLDVTVRASSERYGPPLALKRSFDSHLLEAAEDGAYRRKVGIEYLKGEHAGLRLQWPGEPVPGRVVVKAVSAGAVERLLAELEWQAGSVDVPLDPGALPSGEWVLVLEYTDGSHRAELRRQAVRVIDAKVQASYTLAGRDFDRGTVVGQLTLWPEIGAPEGVELMLQGRLTTGDEESKGVSAMSPVTSSAPSAAAAELEGVQLEIVRRRFDKLEEAVTIPFEVPVPPAGGTLWLSASLSPGDILLTGGQKSFRVPGFDPQDAAGEDPALFPFVVSPWQESPDNVTNVSGWLDKPAGKHGFVTVEAGHFVTGDGRRIRFLGVNCAFSGCFPDHASAERIARQLARFGINLVRFHHMDMQEAPGGIWKRGVFPRELDPAQLDRLDYFIYQLKENGIYTNLNLHVSRTMTPQEGYPEPEKRPDFDKGLSLFDRGIIEHQKAYARALLTHRNPYTGNRYVEEPAVAMIEITNENGLILFTQWGAIDALPERYRARLDALWNRWLLDRYGTTQALAEAWGRDELRAGRELARNGRLEQGLAYWTLETDELSRGASIRVAAGGGPPVEGAPPAALEIHVVSKGAVPWRPQVYHTGLDLRPGGLYRISFWLKADRPRTLTANLMMAHDPWVGFGNASLSAGPEWQRFEFTVRVPESAAVREGRVSFTDLDASAVYWVAALSVEELEGSGTGLPAGESLETAVSRPLWSELWTRSEQVRRDYIAFLWDVEQAYFDEMYRYIKEELGARALVAGTQVQWSPPGIQARLDYVDAHAYWNHPEFPGPSWDAVNWWVRNTSMTTAADGGTITSLAHTRVAGKPYVVSEYNHPAPNTFSSEAFLLAGAYGAFQDWDGLVAFAWSHDADFWPQRIPSFFDIKSHPTKLVTLPAAAALFLRGDVRPGETQVLAVVDGETQRLRLLETTVFGVGSAAGGVPRETALRHRLALVVDGAAAGAGQAPQAGAGGASSGGIVSTDTGELRWLRPPDGRGVVLIDTERSKAVIGYAGPAGTGGAGPSRGDDWPSYELSGVTIAAGPTRQDGWAAITLTAMDGADFQSPGRILVTATGYAENSGMGWETAGDRVTVRNRWGEAPSIVEGIPARIELPVAPERVTVYALDGAGNRRERVPVRGEASGQAAGPSGTPERTGSPRTVIEIGPQYRTLWYEIEIAPAP